MLQISKKYPSKRAFITGAGSGLGKAFALQLAKDNWQIGITDLTEKNVLQTAEEISAAGGKAFHYVFDVSDKTAFSTAVDDFISKNNGIDLIINNAGVGDGGLFGEYSLENWDWILGINLRGVVYGSHLAAIAMKKQQSGTIINIASAAGFANAPSMSMYNVPKAGVVSLSESIFPELKAYNVHVAVVMPTFFKTNIMQHHRGDDFSAKVGQAYIDKSNLLPDAVAHRVLEKAANKKFYIYIPFVSGFLAVIKRIMPNAFLHIKYLIFKKKLNR